MSIFQPPTDSLYKFMAISGLLILGFSIIWPNVELYNLEKQDVQLLGEIKILKIESDDIKKDAKYLLKEVREINALMTE